MTLFSLQNIGRNCFLLLLTLTLMVICGTTLKGQTQTYADTQTNGVTGICIACGVTNPTNPINTASLTDYSNFVVTVGLLGVSVQQTLIFPTVNPNVGCDEIIIRIGSGATLLTANLLGGVTVQSYNGSTANPDAVIVNSSILTLLGVDNQGEIRIKPTASFDRIRLTLSSALIGALSNFRVYYAYSLTGKPVVAATTGATAVCVNSSTTFSNTSPGGAWSSVNTAIATVNTSGLVTGVSAGTTTINYTVTNPTTGCSTTVTRSITVNALPVVNAITGNLSTCISSTTTLSNTTPSGVWSSLNPAIASVNSSGIVTGLSAGTASINYTVTNGNGCITVVSANVVVQIQPSLPAISQRQICLGQSINLSTLNPIDGNGTTGGSYVWSATAGGPALSSTTVSPSLGNTTYYLRYTKDGCFSDSNVVIVVHPKPPTPHVTLN